MATIDQNVSAVIVRIAQEFNGRPTQADLQTLKEELEKEISSSGGEATSGVTDVTIEGTTLYVTQADGTKQEFEIESAASDKLTTAQNINLTGPVTGTGEFDGSKACDIETSLDAESIASMPEEDKQAVKDALGVVDGLSDEDKEKLNDAASKEDLEDYVTLDTAQTISGIKTFSHSPTIKVTTSGDSWLDVAKDDHTFRFGVSGSSDTAGIYDSARGKWVLKSVVSTDLTYYGSETIGNSKTPVYLDAGLVTPCEDVANKDDIEEVKTQLENAASKEELESTKSELESAINEKASTEDLESVKDELEKEIEEGGGSFDGVVNVAFSSNVLTVEKSDGSSNTYTITASSADSATTATKLGSSTVGSATQPIYLSSGTATACNTTVGGTAKPIYSNAGVLTAISSTVGSGTVPIYSSSGTLTASTSTVGSGTKPVYLNSGTITACGTTVGSGTVPIYSSSGTLTASSSTVGSATKPIYLNSGTLTASGSTVGSSSQPVYLSSGTITACTASSIGTVSSYSASSNSGYIKFSNGWIVQWAFTTVSNGGSTLTFPLTFSSSTSYVVVASTTSSSYFAYATRSSASQCKVAYSSSYGDVMYIAMGY